VTGETSKRLDPLNMTMLAISDESMDGIIGDPEVRALLIGAGEAFGGYPSGVLLVGFSPQARGVLVHRQVSHRRREWSRDDRRGSQVGCVA
jgi:hypothetical protein